MKHYGDITKIKGNEVPLVDIITGGSPCQDLSVAGKREGLAGERSGLFMEQIRIVKEMRNESIRQLRSRGTTYNIRSVQPRYMVWENVPGAFSSNKGEDFRCVLEEICRVTDKAANVPMPEKEKWSTSGCIMGDGWSVAWRVHDAQFWGVPQRRKRIALVADFAGESVPEILFEKIRAIEPSMSGDVEKSGETREETPNDTGRGIDKAIGVDAHHLKLTGETAATLNATSCDSPSHSGPSVLQNYTTLNNQPVFVLNDQGGSQMSITENVSGCLRAQEHGHQPVIYGQSSFSNYENQVSTLKASGGDLGGGSENLCINQSVVRRLTPLECERLQGFPDFWTFIGMWRDTKGKLHKDADSPRYKALGNSIALPFWEWMAGRMIKALNKENPTMASLFDGIGGFPLVFSRCGCKPVWASEIEEFPIAVTKRRFPE